MSRTAIHDRDVSVDRAVRLFWERGWHATSLKDIQRVLDMRPGSIYAAFGSKAGLFEAALDRYSQEMSDEFATVVAAAGGPLEGVRSYLREVARACAGAGPDGRWPTPGCMLVKTMLELGDEDAELRARAERVLAAVEDHLTALLRQARERGDLVPEARPRRLARLIQAQIMGLRAFARRRVPGRALTELGEDMGRVLDPWLAVPAQAGTNV
ncbi:MAG: TetR family transcriptional regulator [Gammaproteobacteria bacterium]|nr:TetR family transcriptional regulator [Gammaproteobacteria bacterium]